ncbi:MAG: glycosyltransferase family 4 protein [Oscillospiraceae bacterium]
MYKNLKFEALKGRLLMKKILFLANSHLHLYRLRKELIQSFLDDKNEVYICLSNGNLIDELKGMGCKFIDIYVDSRGTNPLKDSKLLFKYYRIIKKIKPDIVITYTIKPNVYGGLVCRFNKVKYFANITGLGSAFERKGLFSKMATFLYKISLKNVDKVFFQNKGNRQFFLDKKIVNSERTVLINGSGVNVEEYKKEEYPENDETIRFVFIGRIMKEKGIDEIFFVAKKIKERYNNIIFDIIGPMEDNYNKEIKELNENDIINYYGYREDIHPYLKQSHCLILPSYHEGMSNILLEASSVGRPLITTNIDGCREIVIDNENGFLCDVKSEDSLYKNVEKFINLSYGEKKEMADKARKIVVENFRREDITEKIKSEIYKI